MCVTLGLRPVFEMAEQDSSLKKRPCAFKSPANREKQAVIYISWVIMWFAGKLYPSAPSPSLFPLPTLASNWHAAQFQERGTSIGAWAGGGKGNGGVHSEREKAKQTEARRERRRRGGGKRGREGGIGASALFSFLQFFALHRTTYGLSEKLVFRLSGIYHNSKPNSQTDPTSRLFIFMLAGVKKKKS